MKVFKDGKLIRKPVIRYGADNQPAFVADPDGDKIWYPASGFEFKDAKAKVIEKDAKSFKDRIVKKLKK